MVRVGSQKDGRPHYLLAYTGFSSRKVHFSEHQKCTSDDQANREIVDAAKMQES